MDKPKVVNLRFLDKEEKEAIIHGDHKDTVYVGRPTVWGNPFKFSKTEHRQWLLGFSPKALRKYVRKLEGKNLACWCAPNPCHADNLLEFANQEKESDEIMAHMTFLDARGQILWTSGWVTPDEEGQMTPARKTFIMDSPEICARVRSVVFKTSRRKIGR